MQKDFEIEALVERFRRLAESKSGREATAVFTKGFFPERKEWFSPRGAEDLPTLHPGHVVRLRPTLRRVK